jgi:uncharacterized damage-inducible protein DinB
VGVYNYGVHEGHFRKNDIVVSAESEQPDRGFIQGKADRDDALDQLSSRLERAAADLAVVARDVADRCAWDELWADVLDEPPTKKTYGGAIAHIATHGMHHRAQLLYMLRRLGLEALPEGDALGWERQLS